MDAAVSLLRLLALIEALYGEGKTSEEIEAAFDDFFDDNPLADIRNETSGARTTLHRLHDDLVSAGLELEQATDHRGETDQIRYRLRNAATLGPALSEVEQRAVEAVRSLAATLLTGAMRWLVAGDSPPPSTASGPSTDPTGSPEVLGRVFDAVRQRQVIEFGFGIGTRELHPYVVVLGPRGRWFVGGWCRNAEDVRTFPIDEIRQLSTVPQRTYRTPEAADIEAADDTDPLLWDAAESVTATLEFAATATLETYEAFALAPPPDGSSAEGAQREITTANPDWLLSLVAAHWPHVHLLGPEDLLGRFIERLEGLAEPV